VRVGACFCVYVRVCLCRFEGAKSAHRAAAALCAQLGLLLTTKERETERQRERERETERERERERVCVCVCVRVYIGRVVHMNGAYPTYK